MLQNRIRDLIPDMSDDQVRALASRFIDDANLISGDIVLRAAKRGRNASELMGVVLSHYLAKWELGPDQRTGCYFLDDYSEWLGQREENIADLLILNPEIMPDGQRRLSALITEAKYIVEPSLAEKRKESQKQLRDTVRRIEQALFGDPERLDRELWLSRFSDLLLSGIPYAAGEPLDLIGFQTRCARWTVPHICPRLLACVCVGAQRRHRVLRFRRSCGVRGILPGNLFAQQNAGVGHGLRQSNYA